MSKRLAITLIKYGLGLGLLFWVVYSNWDGEGGLGEALQKPAHYGAFLLALVICLVSVLLTFVRWYLLVRAQDLPFTFPAALRLGCVGYFFNTLLPGSVGGDIIKATFIARAQSRRTIAVATVLLDRAVGLCGLFWLAAILGSLFWVTGMLHEVARTPVAITTLETIVIGSIGIMAASLLFWLVLGFLSNERAARIASGLERMGKVGHALAEFWRAVWLYRCRGRSIALALGLAIVGHAGFVLVFFFAAQTFTPAADIPSVGTHFLLVPVGMTIQAGFPAPGGVGAAEYGYGKLYELLGYSAAAGVLGSLTKRMIEWILGFGAYLVYLRMKPQLAHMDEPPAVQSATVQPVDTPRTEAEREEEDQRAETCAETQREPR